MCLAARGTTGAPTGDKLPPYLFQTLHRRHARSCSVFKGRAFAEARLSLRRKGKLCRFLPINALQLFDSLDCEESVLCSQKISIKKVSRFGLPLLP